MQYKAIRVEREGNLAFLTLNRPNKFNAKDIDMLNEMIDALHLLAEDQKIRALVVKGEGKNFCIGLDAEGFINKNPSEIVNFMALNSRMEEAFFRFPKGTVVAIHGLAVMGGALLATLGDLTVMAQNARIGFTAINYGLSCMYTLNYLCRIVGQKRALELVLTGKLLQADEALTIGLVSKVVAPDKVLEAALEAAKLLAEKNPLAVAFTKKARYEVQNLSQVAAVSFLNEHTALLASDKKVQEQLKVSLERGS